MRLSDAIAIGRHLIEHPNSTDYCRCAIGMGLASVGELGRTSLESYRSALRAWPWLNETGPNVASWAAEISYWFKRVEDKQITLDELIDRVRAVEPPEPEIAATEPVTLEEELAHIT